MSLLGIGLTAVGVLVPGAGIAIGIAKLGARVFFGKAGGLIGSAFAFLRSLDPRTLLALVAIGTASFLFVEFRHSRKLLAGDEAWGATVMKEVDRAHGCEPLRKACAIDKSDAAERIHQLTDNARGWRADVEAQNASQRQSAAAAAARDAAARAGAATTAEQKAREAVRSGLRTPDRKTGVSSNEWRNM